MIKFWLSAMVLILLLANQFDHSCSADPEACSVEQCSGNATHFLQLSDSYDRSNIGYHEVHDELKQHCVIPRSELFCMPLSWMCCKSSKYYFLPNSSSGRKRIVIALLLLMSGIESNPGPAILKSNLGLINAHSIVNKTALIHDLINDFKLDMLAVTETWVYEHSPDVHKHEAAPEGFNIVHAHRTPKIGTATAHGGGVALIHRDTIRVKVLPSTAVVATSFELLLVKIVNSVKGFTMAIIYRPPSSSLSVFMTELSDLI